MSRLSRLAAGAAAALALIAPAAAEQQVPPASQPSSPAVLTTPPVPGPPTGAIIRVLGGYVPHNRWLWFDADGTARIRGMLVDGGGRFKSHVDFQSVRKVLDDANACSGKPGTGTSIPPPIGTDMIYYRVDVRCGTTWRVLRKFVQADRDLPDISKIVIGLEAIADKLTWEPTDENVALPDTTPLFRFASPTG
ncbi:MAG TPA: hypothetical protein VHS78_01100 [Candidatus Elarobacter sp.]|jgi:hypothetical protein|nr:hypothetical protein [Candidatus Elarobacter sp.]